MNKTMLLMTLPIFAVASAASAQQTAPTAQPAPVTAAPAPATGTPSTTPVPVADAPAATAQAAPVTNSSATVQAAVDAGFPKYDTDKDGKLSEAEFKAWVTALKTDEQKADGKPANTAEASSYATAAFGSADANKDGVVTREEVTGFLGG